MFLHTKESLISIIKISINLLFAIKYSVIIFKVKNQIKSKLLREFVIKYQFTFLTYLKEKIIFIKFSSL